MPDTRCHRGPDPKDAAQFDASQWPRLRAGVGDLGWLLTRGYAELSALKLVGDRDGLTERQRMALRRSACSDQARARRMLHSVAPSGVAGARLVVDGFNVLTTVEAALGGAVVLIGRDGAVRDLAGVHGTYRKVEETRPALALVGEHLHTLGVAECDWLLDSPVSNSGRLAAIVRAMAAEAGWNWRVELAFNPDKLLAGSNEIVATADAGILDRCERWLNLARLVVERSCPEARVIDLSLEGDESGS